MDGNDRRSRVGIFKGKECEWGAGCLRGDRPGNLHTSVFIAFKFITKRLNSAYFPRLEADPCFVALDIERERLENELNGMLGLTAKVKIEQYIGIRMRCEALKAGHAYCQGLVDGVFFAELFADPAKGGDPLKKETDPEAPRWVDRLNNPNSSGGGA